MKKLLAFALSLALLISVCGIHASALEENLTLTYGTAASGENWAFDGSTLTLSGANISGDVIFSCGKTGRNISVLTTADSTVSGNMYAAFDDYSYSVNYSFASQSNALFTLGGALRAGGNNNETLCVDGATLSLGGLNLGASGAAESFLVVKNGGKLTVNDSVAIQSISLAGASELTINAVGSYGDSALIGNSVLAFSMDDTSSIFLYGNVLAMEAESFDYDFAAFRPFLPAGATVTNYDEFHTTVVDKNGDYMAQMVMGAAAVTGTTENHKVFVKTEDSTTTPAVYSVDVAWDKMEFTYTRSGTLDWDVANQSYTDNTSGTWTTNGNEVAVTNHSNQAVTASFGFTKGSGITDNITGRFDVTSKQLNAGTAGGYATADKVISTLTIEGTLDSAKTTLTTVGVVTVTVR